MNPQPARLEEAAEWFVTLQGRDGSDLPADELRRWEQWIAEPANHEAFDRLASVWAESGAMQRPALPGRAALAADRFEGSQSVADWLTESSRARRTYRPAVAAAALAALAIGGGAYWLVARSPGQADVYQTSRGEHREIRLPDGSKVTLGAGSVLSTQYTEHRRAVVLDRGEVLFTVANDPSRPFVVKAGKATITALGTAFNVLRSTDRVVVTVTEGKVEVRSGRTAKPARLTRGEQMTYDAKGQGSAVAAADPAMVTAWRDGRLRYRREPLRRVIEDVNRYSQRRIAVDPAVAGLEFTGVVFHDQIPQWTAGLERIFPVQIVDTGADTVLIRPRAEDED